MNQEQLESLPYPMFETTEEEKECLKLALQLISDYARSHFLCIIVQYDVGMDCGNELRDKIEDTLGGYGGKTLDTFLGLSGLKPTEMAELRRIWIRKLLAHKSE